MRSVAENSRYAQINIIQDFLFTQELCQKFGGRVRKIYGIGL